MTRLAIAAALALACADPAAPPAPPPDPFARIILAVDSLNVALRDFHASGGRLLHIYSFAFPADTLMPPVVAVSLKRP